MESDRNQSCWLSNGVILLTSAVAATRFAILALGVDFNSLSLGPKATTVFLPSWSSQDLSNVRCGHWRSLNFFHNEQNVLESRKTPQSVHVSCSCSNIDSNSLKNCHYLLDILDNENSMNRCIETVSVARPIEDTLLLFLRLFNVIWVHSNFAYPRVLKSLEN